MIDHSNLNGWELEERNLDSKIEWPERSLAVAAQKVEGSVFMKVLDAS
jgi:hypothetical protein